MSQLERPKVDSKPLQSKTSPREPTPLQIARRAMTWFDTTARNYQAQLEKLPDDATSAEREKLLYMTQVFYRCAADIALKAAPFFNAKLATHTVKPLARTGSSLTLWRQPTETEDDVLARARRETGLIIERAEERLTTDEGLVMIFDEEDRGI